MADSLVGAYLFTLCSKARKKWSSKKKKTDLKEALPIEKGFTACFESIDREGSCKVVREGVPDARANR